MLCCILCTFSFGAVWLHEHLELANRLAALGAELDVNEIYIPSCLLMLERE